MQMLKIMLEQSIKAYLKLKLWRKGVKQFLAAGGAGGGPPLYKPYRYVLPQRVGFLRRFCLKTGIDFADFGLESGQPRPQGASVLGSKARKKRPGDKVDD